MEEEGVKMLEIKDDIEEFGFNLGVIDVDIGDDEKKNWENELKCFWGNNFGICFVFVDLVLRLFGVILEKSKKDKEYGMKFMKKIEKEMGFDNEGIMYVV